MTPTTAQASPPPQESYAVAPLAGPNRLPTSPKKYLAITLGVLLLLIIGFIFYQLVTIGPRLSTSCDARQKQLQARANELKAELSSIRINGQLAQSVTAAPTGDCLTGNSAYGQAEFGVSAPDVTTANMQILQDLRAPDQAGEQTFTPGSENSNVQIDFVSTTIAGTDRSYKVTYYLQTPINCQDFGTPACQTDTDTMRRYDFMQKPISKVRIDLSSTVK